MNDLIIYNFKGCPSKVYNYPYVYSAVKLHKNIFKRENCDFFWFNASFKDIFTEQKIKIIEDIYTFKLASSHFYATCIR